MIHKNKAPRLVTEGLTDGVLLAGVNINQDNRPTLNYQAHRLAVRFGLTPAHAAVLAELAFAAAVSSGVM